MASQNTSPAWLDRPIFKDPSKLFTLENALIALVLTLAILSRFVMLGERVMSHDEVNHVVPSYELYQGKGYRHDPVTHGPFQFHIVALTYFLFGDNDFTSRVPAATFSVAAILFLIFAFRRYLGRSGALIAGVLFLISPYVMFYGRYTRNEAFIELISVVLLYGILRYLDKGDRMGMFLVTLATVMHFIVKETAFIYTAQAMIFLMIMVVVEARRAMERNPGAYNRFLLVMAGALLMIFLALGIGIIKADVDRSAEAEAQTASATAATTTETTTAAPTRLTALQASSQQLLYATIAAIAVGVMLGLVAVFLLARSLGWNTIKQLRSFSLLLLIGTLILPMLSPLPVSMLGWNPLDYQNGISILRTGSFILLFFVLAAALGIWWNPALWLQNALLFYAIFTVFYTTFFTNTDGFLTGIVGSLGYWLSQQGVERGSQPKYYYALIQMPIYEFIAYFGAILATYFGLRHNRISTLPGVAPAHAPRPNQDELPVTGQPDAQTSGVVTTENDVNEENDGQPQPVLDAEPQVNSFSETFYSIPRPLPVLGLFLFWAITSMAAYSLAGERMPWLTVHITMPFLLASAWGLGYLVDTTDWKRILRTDGLLAVLLFPVFLTSVASGLGTLLGTNPPFQGSTLEQLQATNRFILSLIATGASLAGILYLVRNWHWEQILRLATAMFFVLMAVLTARAAYRASFINYDYATEYLVYAHAAPGPKEVLAQVEEISRRTSGDKSIKVAHSNDALYPYWWYFRDYPNNKWYQDTPTRELLDYPIIIAGEDVYNNIEPLVRDDYVQFDYMRLWWPNQDYYNLTLDRVLNVIRDPQMRSAVFQIWLNRDFREYGQVTNQPEAVSPENWSPGATMRMYVRKDIAGQLWEYGTTPVTLDPVLTDPYAEKMVDLSPVQVVGAAGSGPGQFQTPHGIKIAPDGSIYVADSRNHRIQHLAPDGSSLHIWGSFADASAGDAPGGTFNEPWDVAVAPDGSVYVSDTWNHRVQKFTADGQLVRMWGYFGQAENPEAFWGPRGLATDANGNVYVVDTGNKRVAIFDGDGNFIGQFGTPGFGEGQFDEPVGIAIDSQGNAYITDTWNRRVQVFAPSLDLTTFTPSRTWDIAGWNGESLENKPFIAVSPVNGHVFVADPEAPRVIEFDPQGNFVRAWGEYDTTSEGFGMVSGVAVDQNGAVWISDGGNNWLLRFELPE